MDHLTVLFNESVLTRNVLQVMSADGHAISAEKLADQKVRMKHVMPAMCCHCYHCYVTIGWLNRL